MEDDHLRHLCRLGSIVVAQVRDPEFPEWLLDTADAGERQNTMTGLQILGDAFVELARRQGMLPAFSVPARSAQPSPDTTGAKHG